MSTYAPDGWVVSVGEWGTDFDMNTSENQSGNASIEFKNTTPGKDPAIEMSGLMPLEVGRHYKNTMVYKASRANAGDFINLYVDFYNPDGSFHASAQHNISVAPSTSTWIYDETYWYPILHPEVRFARLRVEKAGTDFTMYLDSLACEPAPRTFRAYNDVAQTLAHGSNNVIQFPHEKYDHGSRYDTANHKWVAIRKCTGSFSTGVLVSNMADGQEAEISLLVNGSVASLGTKNGSSAAGNWVGLLACADLELNANDYVQVNVYLYGSSNRDTSGTETTVWFSGHEL